MNIVRYLESGTRITLGDDLSITVEGPNKAAVLGVLSMPQKLEVNHPVFGKRNVNFIPINLSAASGIGMDPYMALIRSILSVPIWMAEMGVYDKLFGMQVRKHLEGKHDQNDHGRKASGTLDDMQKKDIQGRPKLAEMISTVRDEVSQFTDLVKIPKETAAKITAVMREIEGLKRDLLLDGKGTPKVGAITPDQQEHFVKQFNSLRTVLGTALATKSLSLNSANLYLNILERIDDYVSYEKREAN